VPVHVGVVIPFVVVGVSVNGERRRVRLGPRETRSQMTMGRCIRMGMTPTPVPMPRRGPGHVFERSVVAPTADAEGRIPPALEADARTRAGDPFVTSGERMGQWGQFGSTKPFLSLNPSPRFPRPDGLEAGQEGRQDEDHPKVAPLELYLREAAVAAEGGWQ
jgi:hypothetical protein